MNTETRNLCNNLYKNLKSRYDPNNFDVVIPNTMVPCVVVMTAACDPDAANTVAIMYGESKIEISTNYNDKVINLEYNTDQLFETIDEYVCQIPDPIY